MRRIATAVLVGACVVGVAACGGGGSGTVTVKKNGTTLKVPKDCAAKSAAAKHPASCDKFEAKGNDGTSLSTSGGSLPTDFPKSDVPLPTTDNKEITASASLRPDTKRPEIRVWSMTYKLGGLSAAQVYVNTLKSAGFTEESSGSASGHFTANLYKGKYAVSVLAPGDNGANTFFMEVSPYPHPEVRDTTDDTDSSSGM